MEIGDILLFNWSKAYNWKNIGWWYGKLIQTSQYIYMRRLRKDLTSKELWDICGYSHTGQLVAIDRQKGTYTIAEGLSRDFTISEYGIEGTTRNIKDGIILPLKPVYHLQNVEDIVRELEGTGYGFINIVQLAIGTLTRLIPVAALLGRWAAVLPIIRNYTDDALICSEASAKSTRMQSKGKIDIAKEFGVNEDLVLPVYFYFSQYFTKR